MKKVLTIFFIIIILIISYISINYKDIFSHDSKNISEAKQINLIENKYDLISFFLNNQDQFVNFSEEKENINYQLNAVKKDSSFIKTGIQLKENINFIESFKFKDIQFTTAEFSSSKMIMHFWASWCDPCVNELPELLKFLETHANDIKTHKLIVILVSMDFDKESLAKFLKSFPGLKNENYIQIWDYQQLIQNKFQLDKLPSTWVFTNESNLKQYNTVVNWKTFTFEN